MTATGTIKPEPMRDRIEKLSRIVQTKSEEVEQLTGALAGARSRADEAERAARVARDDLASARRDAAAAASLRIDLQRAREDLGAVKHELRVARQLAPPDESQIVEALREAYATKEHELLAEIAEHQVSARQHRERADQAESDLVGLRRDLKDSGSSLEERQGWANATQGELDDVAEVLGLPKDGEHGALRDATLALMQRCVTAEQDRTRAREAAAAATGQLEEARRGGEDPTEGTKARLNALAEIAVRLGLRRNARPADIAATVAGLLVQRSVRGDAPPPAAEDVEALAALERLLTALWPGRAEPGAAPSPPIECADEAVEVIEELREHAHEWANGSSSAAPADFLQRLFDAMLARVEAGDASADMLDRLERMATTTREPSA